jgi:hypothetical protein
MAVIQYTGLVSDIRGKLNGSVLSLGRSGEVIYSKPRQRKEPTAKQLNVRGAFSAAAAEWRELSLSEQADWDTVSSNNPLPNRFGDPVTVSGYNYFKRMMALAYPYGGGSGLIANLSDTPAYEFTPGGFGAEMTLTNQGFKVNFASLDAETINDSAATNQWNLYISLPVIDPSKPYFRTWYFLSSSFFGPNLGIGQELNFTAGNKILSSGFRTFEGATHLYKAICFVPGQGTVSVEQIWSGVASWVGPVVFPDFEYDEDGMPSIAYDGSDGIIDYYWSTTQGNLIRTNFTAETQFAPPQATQAPVPDGDWADTTSSGFTGTGGDSIIIPTSPGGPTGWYGVWYTDVGSAWTPVINWWAPVRMRLVDIATGQTGPWVVGYWPIGIV